jgi:D-alanyl-D-alanine-carboxypeptidase/D-alanyl-D-alanine-endopeptidase
VNAHPVLRCILGWAAILFAGNATAQPLAGTIPAESEIRRLLVERVDTYRHSIGIVVGLIAPEGRRILAYGKYGSGDGRDVDGDTLFEIGSVTKVFTALLLADMVRRGEVALDDPVARSLAPARVPERNGRAIALLDLATHTSGLPRLPTNLAPKDSANPYADYAPERLYDFLATYALGRDIGSQYEYSNLGLGLLGLALSRRAGADYATLVQSRVADALGMTSTRITLSTDLQGRLASGHDADLSGVPSWDFSESFAGAGALRSSANDLLAFLAANLGYVRTPLAAAMADMLEVRRPISAGSHDIALGWHVLKRPSGEIVWHNGQTGGYGSFVGYHAKTGRGSVVLCNVSADVTDLGLHLLDASSPLKKLHKEIAVDPSTFDGLVGRYELTPAFILTVTREADRLFVQATGQARFRVYPEGERRYFYRIVDAQITFETDARGQAIRLILHQNGKDMPARRIAPH